jgi:predicted RNA binding protein YcfA (HicA-like mRNA interferase family)
MSKLPQISGRECVAALEKIGFYFVRQKGSHLYVRRDDPFKQISVPNHKTLKKGMLRSIIRDSGLTVEEFIELL